ncbi:MAG: aa3-type cytochrome c oxidase subunit IV [Caulobacteraceae bacterium]|nr:aa3-type cytochrome c oxidase subunit IV [Caulobacteraceae bacterium]
MAETASDYHHGDQPVAEQVRTYQAFGALTKYACLALAAVILLGALWFCVGVGFFGGLIPAVIVVVAGVVFLRSPRDQH